MPTLTVFQPYRSVHRYEKYVVSYNLFISATTGNLLIIYIYKLYGVKHNGSIQVYTCYSVN